MHTADTNDTSGSAARGAASRPSRRPADTSLLRRIADGSPAVRRWGVMDVTHPSLTRDLGRITVRLDVWPPDVTPLERAALGVAAFGRSIYGKVLAAMAVVGAATASWGVAAAVAAGILAVWTASMIASRGARSRTIRVRAHAKRSGTRRIDAHFEEAVMSLQELDAAGHSRAAYDAEWVRIYDALASRPV